VDYLLPEQFASYRFSDMVVTRRIAYELDCNWKIYAENSTECYHTAMVHGASIGMQIAHPVPHERGEWSSIHMPAERTVAVLPEDSSPFPEIPTLEGRPKSGTHFCLIYPGATFCCTQDCMWWLATYPRGPERSWLSVGSCFPRPTVARPDFEEVVKTYYHRWDVSTPEDNAITARQQAGLQSTLLRTGRMSNEEPVVHDLAVWVKSRVLGANA
jgi:phenylpropionate dioxygenase-like ring-hydroxylating dioxygenase large terminal subunit